MNIKPLEIGNIKSKFPIIQGGMGVGVSLSSLASAVANAGGIGIISGAQPGFKEKNFKDDVDNANINGLTKEIRKAKSLSPNGLIGVNFLVAGSNYTNLVKTAVKEKVDLIISGAGLPKKLPALVKGSNTKIAPIVSSGKAAKLIAKVWDKKHNYLPDLIIVEGPLAGGHLGFKMNDLKSLSMPRLENILVDVLHSIKPFEEKYNKKIPVVAAGGIYDGYDIAKFLKLGASGVQMGSRFVATHECDAHINFKKEYIKSTKKKIKLLMSPVGLPGQAIKNEFLEKVSRQKQKIKRCYRCLEKCNPAKVPFCITDALVEAVNGHTKDGLLFIGKNGSKINEIVHVKDLINELISETKSALK